jgi:hypothetical protein
LPAKESSTRHKACSRSEEGILEPIGHVLWSKYHGGNADVMGVDAASTQGSEGLYETTFLSFKQYTLRTLHRPPGICRTTEACDDRPKSTMKQTKGRMASTFCHDRIDDQEKDRCMQL